MNEFNGRLQSERGVHNERIDENEPAEREEGACQHRQNAVKWQL